MAGIPWGRHLFFPVGQTDKDTRSRQGPGLADTVWVRMSPVDYISGLWVFLIWLCLFRGKKIEKYIIWVCITVSAVSYFLVLWMRVCCFLLTSWLDPGYCHPSGVWRLTPGGKCTAVTWNRRGRYKMTGKKEETAILTRIKHRPRQTCHGSGSLMSWK